MAPARRGAHPGRRDADGCGGLRGPAEAGARAGGRLNAAALAALPIVEARWRLAAVFEAAGLPEPRADAAILVEEATGLDRTALMLCGQEPIGAAADRLAAFVARRLAREPVFRIVGRRSFFGLDLAVTPAVLDPRPDTEVVVAAALEALGSRRSAAMRLADLGTGSGAILCALLSAMPAASGVGVDRSLAACRVADHNLTALGLSDRGWVVLGDWCEPVSPGVDLLVANPPYIETSAIAGLDPEVRDHDPALALDGGPDGLAAYRAIVPALPRVLAQGGVAVVEVGWTQAGEVASLMTANGLDGIEVRRDLGGHARAVVARRRSPPA